MYLLAKFELHILKAFEVTALQSSGNRKIDFTHKENKLQEFKKKQKFKSYITKILELYLIGQISWYPVFNHYPFLHWEQGG